MTNKARPKTGGTPPSPRAGTRRQVLSKAKAVEGLTETAAELAEAEAARRALREKLTKAENRVRELEEKKATFQGHLDEAIRREVAV